MKDERGHIDFLQVFGEVGLGERLDAVVAGLVPAQHALQPERITQALGNFRAFPVGAIERNREVLQELRPVIVPFIAFLRLPRPPMATPVVSDAAVSAVGKEDHLVFPGIGAQRPAVAEDHRLSLPPVLSILAVINRP
jgi:hypothetical protein